jgi:hypothetical protein
MEFAPATIFVGANSMFALARSIIGTLIARASGFTVAHVNRLVAIKSLEPVTDLRVWQARGEVDVGFSG